MKLTYYGTAAGEGWPGLFCYCKFCNAARELKGKNIRTRSQALINDDLLIDLPPDTNMHSLVYGLDLSKINDLLVTHSHSDHFNPMDIELLSEPYAHGRDTLHIYGNRSVEELIVRDVPSEGMTEKAYQFHNAKPIVPIYIKDYIVVPLLALHDRNEECLIYQVTQSDKTLLYAHDTGALPDATINYLKENEVYFDLVSFDCTMQGEADGLNHMGLVDAVKERQRLKDMGLVDENTISIVNHFSHNGLWLHERMEAEAAKYGFITSYDGMSVDF